MNKYISRTVLGVAVVAVGVHGYFWDQTSRQMERFINEAVDRYEADLDNYTVSATYELSRSGYPLSASVSAENFKLVVEDTQTGDVSATFNTSLKMWAEIFSPTTINMSLLNTTMDIPYNDGDEAGNANIEIASILGHSNPLNADKITYNMDVEAVDVYVEREGEEQERLVAINHMNVSGDDRAVDGKDFLRDATQLVTIHGVTVLDMSSQESQKIDTLKVDLALKNFPSEHQAFVEFSDASALQEAGKSVDTKELKAQLLDLVDVMSDEQSHVKLNSFLVEANGYSVDVAADFSVNLDRDAQAQATAKVIGEDVQKIAEMLPIPVLMMAEKGEDGSLMMEAALKDGMVHLSGTPLFPVPSLTDLISNIPDAIDAE